MLNKKEVLKFYKTIIDFIMYIIYNMKSIASQFGESYNKTDSDKILNL